MRALLSSIAVLTLGLSSVAQADPVAWVNWSSSDASSIYGTAFVDGSTVAVTYTGERAFFQTECGTDYWIATGATNPYTSQVVENPPNANTNPAVKCDIIALSQATAKTLEFSEPVTNPIFAVVSLNGNGYRFDRDFEILSFAAGYWGDGTLSKQVTTQSDGTTTYDLIGSGEPHGTIQFIGTFQTVSWTSLTSEYWNGFSIALEHIAANVPPEIQVFAMGAEITSGQADAIDFGAVDVGASQTVDFDIVNSGTGPLNISDISLSGISSANFELGLYPPAIAAGSTTTVSLTLTASAAPAYMATVTIQSDDADEPTFTFDVVGAANIDSDSDGILDALDNCPNTPNMMQEDIDADGVGDACDDDDDGDGVLDSVDNCPLVSNADQTDSDMNGVGDACTDDGDGDGIPNASDNCANAPNPDQADLDSDNIGDACDDDADGDGSTAASDCDDMDSTLSAEQTYYADGDGDGVGDTPMMFCANEPPAGYVTEGGDNCPNVPNALQDDGDDDGVGDACEATPDPNLSKKDDEGGCNCDDARNDRDSKLNALALLGLGLLIRRRRPTRRERGRLGL